HRPESPVGSEKSYAQFYWLARNVWAKCILFGMGCWPKLQGNNPMQKGNNYMLVANHTSMLDIMLMMYISRNPFVFVGKQELAKIPVFGFFYKRVCILVDRKSPNSRMRVYKSVQKRLRQGLGICIFPEGGVPEEHIVLDHFKDGAFKMAIAHGIPIVPLSFLDCKKRFPFHFFNGGPGRLRVKLHPIIETLNCEKEQAAILKAAVRNTILNDLENDAR
ncbi:MAG: lysophospholipid acyltransferase family protein, partial [Bacteroidota bacterium]